MYLNFRLICRNKRANFKHMRSQNMFITLFKMVCIVLHKCSTACHALSHRLHYNVHSGNFPVTFGTETVTVCHHILCSKTRKLVKTVQCIKVSNECTVIKLFTHFSYSDFFFRLITNSINIIRIHCVTAFIFSHFFVDFSLCNFIQNVNNIADRSVFNVPTELDFSLNLITLCNGNLAHIIAETYHFKFLADCITASTSHPICKLCLRFFVLPITYDNLSRHSKS